MIYPLFLSFLLMYGDGIKYEKVSGVIYEETFENGLLFEKAHNEELGTPHALTLSKDIYFQGKTAARFELRVTDPIVKNGKRAEITVVKDEVKRDMWYSFAVYFPADEYEIDTNAAEIISQWKHLSKEGGGSPSTALRVKSDRFILDTGYNNEFGVTKVEKVNRQKIDLGPVEKDQWYEFVFHIIHSSDADGLIEVWKNGDKVLENYGGNYYNVGSLPKWKIGIYKSAFKYEGETDVEKRVVYFDNIRVGVNKVDFKKMSSWQSKTESY